MEDSSTALFGPLQIVPATRYQVEVEIERLHDLLLSLVATLDALDGDADDEPEPHESDLGGLPWVTQSGLILDDCEGNDATGW